MPRLPQLVILLALGLAPGCLATASAYQSLVSEGSTPSTVVFYLVLPVLLATDVVTAPFQYVYVITHAR